MCKSARYPSRGAVLILTLWVIALLSLMAFGLVVRLRFGVRQAQWSGIQLEGRELLVWAAGHCLSRLGDDATADIDSFRDPWGQTFELGGETILSQFDGTNRIRSDCRLRIVAVDETSKVNVNLASEELLIEVLREAGAGPDAADLAKAIVDWRDPDDSGAGERDLYTGLGRDYVPGNGPLARIEEVLFIYGIGPALFFGEDANHNSRLDDEEDDGDLFLPLDNADGQLQWGLCDLLTVFGEGEINVNTAPEPILRAVFRTVLDPFEAEGLAAKLLDRRRGPDGVDGTEDDRPFERYEDLLGFWADNVEPYELSRLTDGDTGTVDFGVVSSLVRFYVSVSFSEEHVVLEAELLTSRGNEGIRVMEWHED